MSHTVLQTAETPAGTSHDLGLFAACLHARHLLAMHRTEAAAIPGFLELTDEINEALERSLGA